MRIPPQSFRWVHSERSLARGGSTLRPGGSFNPRLLPLLLSSTPSPSPHQIKDCASPPGMKEGRGSEECCIVPQESEEGLGRGIYPAIPSHEDEDESKSCAARPGLCVYSDASAVILGARKHPNPFSSRSPPTATAPA